MSKQLKDWSDHMLFDKGNQDELTPIFKKIIKDEEGLQLINTYFLEEDRDQQKRILTELKDKWSSQIVVDYSVNLLIEKLLKRSKKIGDDSYHHCIKILYYLLDSEFMNFWALSRLFVHGKCRDLSLELEIPYKEVLEKLIIQDMRRRHDDFTKDNLESYMKKAEFEEEYHEKILLQSKYHDVRSISAYCLLSLNKERTQDEIYGYQQYIKAYIQYKLTNSLYPCMNQGDQESISHYLSSSDVPQPVIQLKQQFDAEELQELIALCFELREVEYFDKVLDLLIQLDSHSVITRLTCYIEGTHYVYSHTDVCSSVIEYMTKKESRLTKLIMWSAHRSDKLTVTENCYVSYYQQYPEAYKKALAQSTGSARNQLYFPLVLENKCDEAIKDFEQLLKEETTEFLKKNGFDQQCLQSFEDFITKDQDFSKIKLAKGFKNSYIYLHNLNTLYYLTLLNGRSPVFEPYFKYYFHLALSNDRLISPILKVFRFDQGDEGYEEKFFKGCQRLDIDNSLQSAYAVTVVNTTGAHNDENANVMKVFLNMMKEDLEACCGAMAHISATAKEELIKLVQSYVKSSDSQKDQEIYRNLLLDSMAFTANVVKTAVKEAIMNHEQCKEIGLEGLKSKKAGPREVAVDVLGSCLDEEIKTTLEALLEKEKSIKVKNKIYEILGHEDTDTSSDNEGSLSLLEYCSKKLNKSKRSKIKWTDIASLPPIRYQDKEETIDQVIYEYLLTVYSDTDGITLNEEGQRITKELNKKDLANVALHLLTRWLDLNAEAKKKWVLIFCATYGDSRTVMVLQDKIKKWPEMSRGTMATYAVKALGLNGSDEALFFLDGIRLKFKFKQVKNAAAEALSIAATELGIDPEELSDKLVPTLGFDEEGTLVFDYGTRKFTVRLSKDLTLEVFKEDGKKMKNLPAVGKNDDQEKGTEARENFKLLKKQLKTVMTGQRDRLEFALSTMRYWKAEQWTNLFVKNHLMHKFAESLIWGIYVDGQLKESFRYMDDGTFNTYDEDELELKECMESHGSTASIGLVHPIELEDEVLEAWKEQLEDYEITQPFPQIERQLYKVTDEEVKRKTIERFGGYTLGGLSLVGKLSKLGWYRGSIQDAGCYDTYYKEIGSVGVQLNFSYLWVGMTAYDQEETVIYEYVFYKAGGVRRGSYIYDNVSYETLINPGDVPQRIFSEIAYDLHTVTEKVSVRNEDWKLDNNYSEMKLEKETK